MSKNNRGGFHYRREASSSQRKTKTGSIMIATIPIQKWYSFSKSCSSSQFTTNPTFNCVVNWELEQLFLERIPLLKGYCSDQL